MTYPLIALLICLLVLLFTYRHPPRAVSYADLHEMGLAFRTYTKGFVPLDYRPFGVFGRAVRALNRDVKARRELYSFEKWLRDNDYMIERALSSVRNAALHRLPTTAGTPRVLTLCRYIVAHTDALTRERIQASLTDLGAVTPVFWQEAAHIPDGLRLAVLERLAELSRASLDLRRMRALAAAGGRNRAQSDAYLYYAYVENGYKPPEGVDVDGVKRRFWQYLIREEGKAKQYLAMLTAIDDVSQEYLMTLSETGNALALDENVSRETRLACLARVSYLAERYNVQEVAVAHICRHVAETVGVDVTAALFDQGAFRRYMRTGVSRLTPLSKGRERAYIACCALATALLAGLPLAAGTDYVPIVSCVLAFGVAWPFARGMVGWFWRRNPACDCRMGYAEVPDEGKTVVVVSRYVGGEEDLAEAVRRLRALSHNSPKRNLHYCLLIDFAKADAPWTEKDETLLAAVKAYAREDGLCYAVRKRVPDGDRYVAWERKRGAIMDYFEALQTGDSSKFVYTSYTPQGCKLAVLLDDDSRLMPLGVLDAVNRMLHPANRRYDLMTFDARYRVASVGRRYGLRYARYREEGAYPVDGDFYADAFGRAIYSGKAIVRIDAYLAKLRDAFPDERILSHDVIEGAILSSGRLRQVVFEDVPNTFLADRARTARWQRGDLLLAPYLAPVVKGRRGKRLNGIAPVYKAVIWENILSVLRPFFALSMVFLGAIRGSLYLALLGVGYYLAPFLPSLLGAIYSWESKRLRYALGEVGYVLLQIVENLVLLPLRAIDGFFTFCATAFGSIAGRNMLVWKPFFTTQKKSGFVRYLVAFLPSAVGAVMLALLSFNLWFVVYMAFTLTAVLWVADERELRVPQVPAKYSREVVDVMRRTYRYFVDNAPHGLIKDNLQVRPVPGGQDMTSPTDMGFAVLAEVTAIVAQLAPDGWERLKTVLARIGELERWQGHLYNWYGVDGRVLERVVSTVDSANFMACVLCAEQLAIEEGRRDIVELCRPFLGASFAEFFDFDRNMLSIVRRVDEGKNEGYYDTLASEARLAYYLAAAEGLPVKAYYGLSRACVRYGGNTLVSWGGTAFEYLLPRVFVTPPVGSLLHRSERNAARMQAHSPVDGVYGISESCYYAFNDQMRYRYQANGIEALAMHPDCGGEAVSPYASALTAAYYPQAAFQNLLRLKERGAYGAYGFYEAVEGNRVVEAYMAHHQGMTLAALCNAVCDNAISRLFMRNARMECALLLANERGEEGRRPFRTVKRTPIAVFAPKRFVYPYPVRAAHVLSSGEMKGVYLSDGRQELHIGRDLVDGLAIGKNYAAERFVLVERVSDGRLFSPYPEVTDVGAEYAFEVEGGAVVYRNLTYATSETVRLSPDGQTEVRDLRIDNPTDAPEVYRVAVYFPLTLTDEGGALSHAAYRNMFVRTAIAEGVSAWREEGGECKSRVFVDVQGLDAVRYETNRRNFPHRNFLPREAFDCFDGEYPHEGAVLYPCFAATGRVVVPPNGSARVYLCCGKATGSAAECAAAHKTIYLTHATDYYGLSECLSSAARVFDKYADERVAPALASVLLDNEERVAAQLGGADGVRVLPYTTNFRENLTNALVVRLCEGVADVRIFRPSEDRQGALVAQVAARLVDVGAAFTPRGARWARRRFSPSARPTMPTPVWVTGEGAFVVGGAYAVRPVDRATRMPYANVVSNGAIGFVLTENGGGYFFGRNSRQNKLTYWRNDPMNDLPTHILGATDGAAHYRLNDARYSLCTHGKDFTRFCTIIGDNRVEATYRIAGNKIRVDVEQTGELWLYLDFVPLLDWRPNENCYLKKRTEHAAVVENARTRQTMTFAVSQGEIYTSVKGLSALVHGEAPVEDAFDLVGGAAQRKRVTFYLAEGQPKGNAVYELTVPYGVVGARPLDYLLEGAWRQLVHSRLHAKTAFYQCGGAWGFRDQLQDIAAYMPYDEGAARRLLLHFAAHQYAEGDVMHWWHEPNTGVRTQITDDRLFLVWAACRYLDMTEDRAFLDERVPFLLSEPLGKGVPSRYETPTVSREKYTMREHLRRAATSVLRFGKHDLLLVYGGDWNDGVNAIGLLGEGESVWLSMFAYRVIERAKSLFEGESELFDKRLARLRHGVRKAFVKDRFFAYTTDDGRTVGGGDGDCALYLMTQAFGALSGAVEPDMARLALQTAKRLVDYENGLIRLFAPPFAPQDKVGYIADYPKGIRENGGQYTHAALWYCLALVEVGEVEYAYELLRLLNPIEKCAGKRAAVAYGVEPYVLAADVYTADGYTGAGGWTWYTGSAAWAIMLIVEWFYGVRVCRNTLTVHPRLPKALGDTELRYLWRGQTFHIYYRFGEEESLTVDGEEKRCLLPEDATKHVVCTTKRCN